MAISVALTRLRSGVAAIVRSELGGAVTPVPGQDPVTPWVTWRPSYHGHLLGAHMHSAKSSAQPDQEGWHMQVAAVGHCDVSMAK